MLRKKVGAQKLALGAINSNHQIAKMKALMRLSNYGSSKINSKIEEAIKANLDRIAGLKDAINVVENENAELAKQNDVFRSGALDGIQMVRNMDNLTQDRDKLSVDLADKALTIRKLLEDNQFLQGRISALENEKDKLKSSIN